MNCVYTSPPSLKCPSGLRKSLVRRGCTLYNLCSVHTIIEDCESDCLRNTFRCRTGQIWSGGSLLAGRSACPGNAPAQVEIFFEKILGNIFGKTPTFALTRRGLHTSSNELEVMAKITTFLVVFVAIFCGWPCLLHFMAGEPKYSSSC